MGKLSDLFRKLADEVEDDDVEKAWDEFAIEVPISKTDPEQRLAFGWANVAFRKDGSLVLDRQDDFVDDIAELEKTAYRYVVESRDAGQDHARRGVATLVESMVFTPEKLEKMGLPEGSVPLGWWTGYHVHDDEVWEGVKDGTYPAFSIHGLGKRHPVEEVAKIGLKHEHGKGDTCPICSKKKPDDGTEEKPEGKPEMQAKLKGHPVKPMVQEQPGGKAVKPKLADMSGGHGGRQAPPAPLSAPKDRFRERATKRFGLDPAWEGGSGKKAWAVHQGDFVKGETKYAMVRANDAKGAIDTAVEVSDGALDAASKLKLAEIPAAEFDAAAPPPPPPAKLRQPAV